MTLRKKLVITTDDDHQLRALLDSDADFEAGDESSLRSLRRKLDDARVVLTDKVAADVVTMNSVVRLRVDREKSVDTYTLVYPNSANIAEGKLSILAPIGTAILGYRVSDSVEWEVPGGKIRVRIQEVVFQPKRDAAAV